MNINYEDIEKNLFLHVSQMMRWGCKTVEDLPKDLRKSLRSKIERISDGFTSERKENFQPYLESDLDVAAYAMYFHSSSMRRFSKVLEDIPVQSSDLPKQISILDVGSGTGAASEAVLLWLSQMRKKRLIKIQLLDQSSHAMSFAKDHLTRTSLAPIGVKTLKKDLNSVQPINESFDIYVFSNVINELGSNASIQNIVKGMKATSVLIFVEPALKSSSRILMTCKDQITDLGLHIWAPCTHDYSCPMLKDENEWCHFETNWNMGPFRSAMDSALGHRSENLHYSYLVAGKQKVKFKKQRVLSSKLKSKIKKTNCIHVCGEKDIEHYYFDKKNPALKNVQKGDLIQIQQKVPFDQAKRFYPNAKSFWLDE